MHVVCGAIATTILFFAANTYAQNGDKHMEAKGTFEVHVRPAESNPFEKAIGAARYELEKTWTGDFEGTSKGEMLTSFTESTNAAAYVALEHITGLLNGRNGSFYLAHRATMTKGDAASGEMDITVVKGSGTGQLHGIRGNLTIIIDAAGKHSYVFRYELP